MLASIALAGAGPLRFSAKMRRFSQRYPMQLKFRAKCLRDQLAGFAVQFVLKID